MSHPLHLATLVPRAQGNVWPGLTTSEEGNKIESSIALPGDQGTAMYCQKGLAKDGIGEALSINVKKSS